MRPNNCVMVVLPYGRPRIPIYICIRLPSAVVSIYEPSAKKVPARCRHRHKGRQNDGGSRRQVDRQAVHKVPMTASWWQQFRQQSRPWSASLTQHRYSRGTPGRRHGRAFPQPAARDAGHGSTRELRTGGCAGMVSEQQPGSERRACSARSGYAALLPNRAGASRRSSRRSGLYESARRSMDTITRSSPRGRIGCRRSGWVCRCSTAVHVAFSIRWRVIAGFD